MGTTKTVQVNVDHTLLSHAPIEVADVIEYMRAQLIESETRRVRDGLLPLFEVDKLEIELKMVLRESADSSGKVDLRLLALTAGDQVQTEQTHTINLTLRSADKAQVHQPSGRVSGLRPAVRRDGA